VPQPVRAIPAQTKPIMARTGFLPIGFPFPVRERKAAALNPSAADFVRSPSADRAGRYVVASAGKVKSNEVPPHAHEAMNSFVLGPGGE
jgi:hypothetical protein